MSILPENEKVIKLNKDDSEEEGWVDTHHGSSMQYGHHSCLSSYFVGMDQTSEEVTEMTLEDSNFLHTVSKVK